METTNFEEARVTKPPKWFRRHRLWHDPLLVLNMSTFDFDSGWNRIFNPIPQRENIWGAHAPRVSCSAPSAKNSFHFAANQSSS
jgi:hypothetical protein